MARIRSIHPDACRSRKLAGCTADAERVYWRLHPHCDDEGRVEDEPDMLASLLFQVMRHVTPDMLDGWLWELHDAGLIDRYEANKAFYLEVRRWTDYQHPQRKKNSTIPAGPSGGSRTSKRRVRDGSDTDRGGVPSGGEWSGEGEADGEHVRDTPHEDPVFIPGTGLVASKPDFPAEGSPMPPELLARIGKAS